jgi:hypothetical protein
MELLAVLWVFGLLVYFSVTNERQRENHLLVMWLLLLLPAILVPLKLLLGL